MENTLPLSNQYLTHPYKFYEPFDGYLQKKGEKGLFKTWKSRWFLLKNNILSYREYPNDPEPLGSIYLGEATSIGPCSEHGDGPYFQVFRKFQ
jgi:hypothetical protein